MTGRRMPNPDQEPENEEFETEAVDFTSLVRRTKNMRDPKLALEIGEYTAEGTAMFGKLLISTHMANRTGNDRAPYLKVERLKKGAADLLATPTAEAGPDTVAVKWPKKGNRPKVDLWDWLQNNPLQIPPGHRAMIPVEKKTRKNENESDAMIIRFSQVTYAKITARTTKNNNKQSGDKSGGESEPKKAG